MRAIPSRTSAFSDQRDSGVLVGTGSLRSLGGAVDESRRNLPPNPLLDALPVLHLLVVDEDDSVRGACAEIARKMNFAVATARDVADARTLLTHQKVDVLLLDLKGPAKSGANQSGANQSGANQSGANQAGGAHSGSGLDLLEEVKSLYPETVVVVMTAFATVANAVEAMRVGAGDYLTKPFALEELMAVLERAGEQRHFDLETRRLRERLRTQRGSGSLIGRAPEMEKLFRILSKVAATTHPVLILGETGTGKELIARQIHFHGPNASKPFVPVDCGSLVPQMIESELFGCVKGAVPGVTRSRDGLLAAAEGGTVFLDEIGELPLELQAKLLRALQERAIVPVGGTVPVPISARILAATNRDLAGMVEGGRFRKDLYFRLNVVNLRIPPLRDRKEDILLLAQYFVERCGKETGTHHTFSDDALRILMSYSWPGNVRELENAVERACALSSGPILHMGDLPTQLQDFRLHERATRNQAPEAEEVDERILSIAEMERKAILATIRQLKGDKLMAAKLLGIGKTTLYRKLKEYGITEEDGLE